MNNEKKLWEKLIDDFYNDVVSGVVKLIKYNDGKIEPEQFLASYMAQRGWDKEIPDFISKVIKDTRLQAIDDCIEVVENESNPYHSRDNKAEYDGFNTAQKDISTALSALK